MNANSEENAVQAAPTKTFFVDMLTRDIDLKYAILDLVDNCVDGVLRCLKEREPQDPNKPYAGYSAHISADAERFLIADNCGGIPREVTKSYAFRLGRPLGERDEDIETIGMYGIGMKRAIFKMGRHAVVRSKPNGGTYAIEIPPEWLKDDDDWRLELRESGEELPERGTEILVQDLRPAISKEFDIEHKGADFLSDLRNTISQHYALILMKGLKIDLNGESIEPAKLEILDTEDLAEGHKAIEPYVFKGEIDDVEVFLAVGFHRNPPSQGEMDEEEQQSRSSDRAGWTVICNDRVVVHRDKSTLTGWGLGMVPRYHNQFIAISGVVYFRSKNAEKLPLNTTKRGLDTSAEVYHVVLQYMQEGIKYFTNFTSRWKGREGEVADYFKQTKRVLPLNLEAKLGDDSTHEVRKLTQQGLGQGRRRTPNLPEPEPTRPYRRVVFARPQEQIKRVAAFLFEDEDASPGEVGAECFDKAYKEAEQGED